MPDDTNVLADTEITAGAQAALDAAVASDPVAEPAAEEAKPSGRGARTGRKPSNVAPAPEKLSETAKVSNRRLDASVPGYEAEVVAPNGAKLTIKTF